MSNVACLPTTGWKLNEEYFFLSHLLSITYSKMSSNLKILTVSLIYYDE